MDALNGIFKTIGFKVDNFLSTNFIDKRILAGNYETRTKLTRGIHPRPVGANMDSEISLGRSESVAVAGAFLVLIELAGGRITNLEFLRETLESLDTGGSCGLG